MQTFISFDYDFSEGLSKKRPQKNGKMSKVCYISITGWIMSIQPNPLIFLLLQGSPKLVSRVLDVVKGQLCFVIGTVYMDMPLKPNVLDDIGRDVSRYIFTFSFHPLTLRSIPSLLHHFRKKFTPKMIRSCLRMNQAE
jgi:hypothetical protein